MQGPQILVHSVITNRDGTDGKVKIRGAAGAEGDLVVQRRYADVAASEVGESRCRDASTCSTTISTWSARLAITRRLAVNKWRYGRERRYNSARRAVKVHARKSFGGGLPS